MVSILKCCGRGLANYHVTVKAMMEDFENQEDLSIWDNTPSWRCEVTNRPVTSGPNGWMHGDDEMSAYFRDYDFGSNFNPTVTPEDHDLDGMQTYLPDADYDVIYAGIRE